MRFGLVHRIMTDALAALGILALIASGQFNRWVSGVILAGLVLALLVRESWQRHPALRHLGTGAVLLLAAVEIGRLIFDTSALDVIIESAAGAQIIRLATRKGAAHDQQVIVLAFLHLIAGTVLGGGIGYGLCFFGVLIVAPGALVLSHLRREVEGNYRQGARDRTGLPVDVPRILRSRRVVGRSFLAVTCLLSIPIFCFTAVLFILFPRVGLSLLLLNRGPTGRMVGFTGHVDLGEVGVLRSDATLAMRVEVPGLAEPPPQRYPLYLRGTALDVYDGRAWSQSDSTRRAAEAGSNWIIAIDASDVTEEHVMRIDLEPIEPPVIFIPPHATGMRFRTRGQIGMDNGVLALRGPEGEFRYQPLDDRGLRYEVFLSKRVQTFRRLPPAERSRYLNVPSNLPVRIRALATEWARSAQTPYDRARAIEQHLRTEYRYDLASPSGRDPQPLDHFLFESKRGHCEFYSTAMAIMLRTLDVPTRNVTGFVGGTYNRFGRFYAVRQGDAHSWVEVFLDEQGWVTFDPTPPADSAPKSDVDGFLARVRELLEATSQRWDQHVVRYDFNQQLSIVQRFTSRYKKTGTILPEGVSPVRIIVGFTFLAGGVGLAIWWLRRKRNHGLRAARSDEVRSPSASLAIALYEALDSAMSYQGIARGPSIPPLRHARNLLSQAHPLAAEIIDLTETYLDARFGGLPISDEQRRDFERRVSAIRQTDPRAQRMA